VVVPQALMEMGVPAQPFGKFPTEVGQEVLEMRLWVELEGSHMKMLRVAQEEQTQRAVAVAVAALASMHRPCR
jgi:hypothetical protein